MGTSYNLSYGYQVIRGAIGSPGSTYVFDVVKDHVLVDNLGSNTVFFNLDTSLNLAGSNFITLHSGTSMSFDLKTGSLIAQSSGTTVTEVQFIGLE